MLFSSGTKLAVLTALLSAPALALPAAKRSSNTSLAGQHAVHAGGHRDLGSTGNSTLAHTLHPLSGTATGTNSLNGTTKHGTHQHRHGQHRHDQHRHTQSVGHRRRRRPHRHSQEQHRDTHRHTTHHSPTRHGTGSSSHGHQHHREDERKGSLTPNKHQTESKLDSVNVTRHSTEPLRAGNQDKVKRDLSGTELKGGSGNSTTPDASTSVNGTTTGTRHGAHRHHNTRPAGRHSLHHQSRPHSHHSHSHSQHPHRHSRHHSPMRHVAGPASRHHTSGATGSNDQPQLKKQAMDTTQHKSEVPQGNQGQTRRNLHDEELEARLFAPTPWGMAARVGMNAAKHAVHHHHHHHHDDNNKNKNSRRELLDDFEEY